MHKFGTIQVLGIKFVAINENGKKMIKIITLYILGERWPP
jgi:hypothetical protein